MEKGLAIPFIKSVENSTKAEAVKKKAATKKKVVKKKTPAKKAAQKATAFDTIVGIIVKSKKGVNTSQLKAKTGFDDKKIANIIYKAKNRELIKSISKGVYTKV